MPDGREPESPSLPPEEQAALNALFAEVVASFRGGGRDPDTIQSAVGAQVLYALQQQAAAGVAWAQQVLALWTHGPAVGFREAAAAAGLAPHPGPQLANTDPEEAEG